MVERLDHMKAGPERDQVLAKLTQEIITLSPDEQLRQVSRLQRLDTVKEGGP